MKKKIFIYFNEKKNIYIIVTAVHQYEFSDLFKNFSENNLLYPLKKVTDPDPEAQKSTDPTGSGFSSLDILCKFFIPLLKSIITYPVVYEIKTFKLKRVNIISYQHVENGSL